MSDRFILPYKIITDSVTGWHKGCWWQNSDLVDILKKLVTDRISFDTNISNLSTIRHQNPWSKLNGPSSSRSSRFNNSSLNCWRPYTLWFQNGRLIWSYYLNNRIDNFTLVMDFEILRIFRKLIELKIIP